MTACIRHENQSIAMHFKGECGILSASIAFVSHIDSFITDTVEATKENSMHSA